MNGDQRVAVIKAVQANDYALILGMPGTGKTSTTAFAVRCLLALRKTVLVTSYTHSAVDNLLKKLLEKGVVDFLRLGMASLVDEALHFALVSERGNGSPHGSARARKHVKHESAGVRTCISAVCTGALMAHVETV